MTPAPCLDNLLSNAIKDSPDGGKATVRATSTAEGVVCEVAGSRMGMTGEDPDRLIIDAARGNCPKTKKYPVFRCYVEQTSLSGADRCQLEESPATAHP